MSVRCFKNLRAFTNKYFKQMLSKKYCNKYYGSLQSVPTRTTFEITDFISRYCKDVYNYILIM